VAALFILTRFNTQRFEFIFTSLNENAQQLQAVVTSVHAAYNDSLLFRELRLRGGALGREVPGCRPSTTC
jgi:Bardet-Biedl syndrome 5 protein